LVEDVQKKKKEVTKRRKHEFRKNKYGHHLA
jgi:hypothetical protein